VPRPGFVLEVDGAAPPVLFHHGDQLRLERLPVGRSRALYPAERVAALAQPAESVDHALAHPVGDVAPLADLLAGARRLTVAFDDLSSPVPPMRRPDARQLVLEAVLDLAAAAGIDDVALVAARGLGRRMTEGELRHLVGDRVYDSFAPHGLLVAHDAEDATELVALADGDGAEVELSARAASSDVLVCVGVAQPAGAGGRPGTLAGLCGAPTLRADQGLGAGPDRTALDRRAYNALAAAGVAVFQVEVTLDDDVYGTDGPLAVLQRREWEWSPRQRLTFAALHRSLDALPHAARHRAVRSWRAPMRITSVHAGAPAAVRAAVDDQLARQHVLAVDGQTDVVTVGLPSGCGDDVGSLTNPILVAWLGLAHLLGMHTGTPLVRDGGVAILSHPVRPEVDPVHHPSAVDLFDQVLPETTDAAEIDARFEETYATDDWYRHLYRSAYAEHGVRPLHRWYEARRAQSRLGRVIVVGGDAPTVRRLGLQPASTLQDALEMASDVVGADPSLTHLRVPPSIVADVS
jgi:hypothetical protein